MRALFFPPIFNMKAETYLRDDFLERVSARIANPLSTAPANAVGWDVSPVSAIFWRYRSDNAMWDSRSSG